MNKNRFFNVLVGLLLALTAALTARQAVVTADTVTAGRSASEGSAVDCPLSAEERASIQAVYQPQAHGAWARSDAGFVGPEGGLLTVLDC